MPDSNKCHITMILDRSGSMASIRTDVIGAVNKFIDDQKSVPGECTFTLVQFDDKDPYEVIQNQVRMSEARHLTAETFAPRGNTPLLDAIGKGIASLGDDLRKLPEASRPGKVIFVVETDGQENASKEYTRQQVADMIKLQTETYKWQFVFLGANQDAIATGAGMNIAQTSSLTYAANAAGVSASNVRMSCNVKSYRTGAVASVTFSDADRDAAMSK